jgi:hypothetical protein
MIDQQFLVVVLLVGLINFFAALGVWFMIWSWKGYKESKDRETGFLMSVIAYTGLMCFVVGIILTFDGILLGVVRYIG